MVCESIRATITWDDIERWVSEYKIVVDEHDLDGLKALKDLGPCTPLEIAEHGPELAPVDDILWLLTLPQVLGEPLQRLVACAIAEEVLPIFNKHYPHDGRPRRAIETARRYALGRASHMVLKAAEAAAWLASQSDLTKLDAMFAGTACSVAAETCERHYLYTVCADVALARRFADDMRIPQQWTRKHHLDMLTRVLRREIDLYAMARNDIQETVGL